MEKNKKGWPRNTASETPRNKAETRRLTRDKKYINTLYVT